MTDQVQTMEIDLELLREITEGFRETIFNQHTLIEYAKKAVDENNYQALNALVISIDRFNDDLFRLYERVYDLCEPE
jgi:predicted negative regulator of RcsB-dependent stress response